MKRFLLVVLLVGSFILTGRVGLAQIAADPAGITVTGVGSASTPAESAEMEVILSDFDAYMGMPTLPQAEATPNAAAQDRVSTDQGNVVGRDLGPSAGFAVFSLNGGYRFNDHVQLTAGIDNLFDRAYSEHLNLAGNSAFGYPADPQRINEPGRTAWVKLNFSY